MVFERQTPSKLTIWDVSYSFWVIVFCFGLMGAYYISSSFSVTTITCHRWLQNQGNCTLFEFTFPFVQMRNIPINTLKGAYFKSNFSGRSLSYKIVLLTQSGEIYIANSSHPGEKEYIAPQIDSFIRNSNSTVLNVRQKGQLVDLFWGLLFWAGGILCLFLNGDQIEVLTCSWDKTLKRIVLQQRNFLSLSTGNLEWSIEDIDSVTIESTVHLTMNRFFQTVTYKKYYLVLISKSGTRLRLTFYGTVLLKNKEKVVEYISKLLTRTTNSE